MNEFSISAFADEYSPDISEQIRILTGNGVNLIEPRGVFGKNISELSVKEAEELAKILSDANIGISAVGSPAGKADIKDAEDHMRIYENILRTAEILGAKRIRGFSFYCSGEKDRDAVKRALDPMITSAFKRGILYCHENEKGIYGDTADRCLDIMKTFEGSVGCVFDPANFIQCGENAEEAFDKLYPYITYLHIKDALKDGTVVAAGEGESNFAKILGRLNADKRYLTLTLEPHLKTFDGLSALENGERSKIRTVFKTNAEAFNYALQKLKNLIKNIKTEDN